VDSNKVSDWLIHEVDDYDLASFIPVAARLGQDRFGYVVTHNFDYLVRYSEDPVFRGHYRTADYVLLDSLFAAYALRIVKGVRLRVCTGSALTAALLATIVRPAARIVIIGGSSEQADTIAELHGLTNLRHYNPPMGFAKDLDAVEECLQFIESQSPFRFCFLAVGSPQHESLAALLQAR